MRWLVSFTVLHSIVSHALALYSASPPSAVKLKNRTLQQPEALFRISKTARLNRETSDGWSPRAHLESSNNEGTRPYSSIRTQSHTFTAIRTTKAQTSSQRCVTLKARPLAIRPWTLGLEPIAPQPNDRTRSTTSLICSHRPGAIRVQAHDSRRRPLQEFFVVFANHRLRAMRQPNTKNFAEQLFARIGALRFQTSTIETTM